MLTEALSIGAVVQTQLTSNRAPIEALANFIQHRQLHTAVTIARGSSDHAAHYFAYLAMARLGWLVSSLPMSLVTLEQAPLPLKGVIALAFSQSGRSPDLIAPIEYFGRGNNCTVAIVNRVDSPLARSAGFVIDVHAGSELSVAATKSMAAQMVAGAHLVGQLLPQEQRLEWQESLQQLPLALERAVRLASDPAWGKALAQLVDCNRLVVLGRGSALAVAQEAALKLKETCGIQAEAFSTAEFSHGPMALIEAGYPVLLFALRGNALGPSLQQARELQQRGAAVMVIASDPHDLPLVLPTSQAQHSDHDPICAIQSFYLFVECLARMRGLNPDQPQHLSKVTLTR